MKKVDEQSANKVTNILIALLLPPVGIVLGILLLAKSGSPDKKLGETTLAFSVLFSILWGVLFYLFMPTMSFSNGLTTNTPASNENISASVELKKHSLGEAAVAEGVEVTLIEVNDNVDIGYPSQTQGNKYVQVKLQLKSAGSTQVSGNANLMFGATRSDRQSATIAFSATNSCTNFNNGNYSIEAGSSATGCVYFEIPGDTHLSHVFYGDTLSPEVAPKLSWEL